MNFEQNLEQRADSQAGINIIKACLEQIKNYNDFRNKREILTNFLKTGYPDIKKVDIMAIIDMLSKQLENYEYDYRRLKGRPSTAFGHPFVPERKDGVLEKILDLIKSSEKDYIESLSQLYSEYS